MKGVFCLDKWMRCRSVVNATCCTNYQTDESLLYANMRRWKISGRKAVTFKW